MLHKAVDKEMLRGIREKLNQGMLPQWVGSDPEIYRLELEKIFARTWNFLGHESELAEPGSFITRWIVNDPILIVRNKENQIKGFFNSCTHRGTRLCTADHGNKKTFLCPFHGWTFDLDGELVGIVAGDMAYGEHLDRKEWALRPIPRLETHKGMIFGSLDPDAMPLDQFLGGLAWYWDLFFSRSDQGLEVRGTPQRWILHTHWKQGAENFGDPYHAITSHRSTMEVGNRPKTALLSAYGNMIVLEHGHGLSITNGPPGVQIPPYQALPENLHSMFQRNLSGDQLNIFRNSFVNVGTCFPNLSWVSPVHGSGEQSVSYINFRVWRPLSPDTIEICSWFMIDKEAPEEYKEASYRAYIRDFGPAGNLEQDDMEIWTRVTEASKGFMARNKDLNYNNVLNYAMGLHHTKPLEDWPGPGTAYGTTLVDAISRGFYNYWIELLDQE